jgi:elongation factor G
VFKIIPAKTGDLYWVRVYSGSLKANSRILNTTRDVKENVAQLWHIHATKKEREGQVDQVDTGDIVGVIGPRNSITGDTWCETKHPILLDTIEFPQSVISMAIEPESTTERKKLSEVLEMMKRQDPTFSAAENQETGQTLISGMGELHLEVIKHRLLRDFNLNVKVHKPRVNYRETIKNAVEVEGQCNRMIAGQQLFARVKIRLEPTGDHKGKIPVINRCPHDAVPPDLMMAAVEELESRTEGGGLIGGFPLSMMKITLLSAEYQPENSNEVAFHIAAGDAFDQALRQGQPVLLEPIMKLDVTTPEEHMGDFVGDLQQRRGIIVHTDTRGSMILIEAHAPLAELFGYSSAMRSLSQGRAGCSMEPLKYGPAPQDIADSFGM